MPSERLPGDRNVNEVEDFLGEFVCPFCSKCVAVSVEGLAHETPMCKKFDDMRPEEFLAAAVAARLGVPN